MTTKKFEFGTWALVVLTLGIGVLTLVGGYYPTAGIFLGFCFVWTLFAYLYGFRFPGVNPYSLPRWAWNLIGSGGMLLLVVESVTSGAKIQTLLRGFFFGTSAGLGFLAMLVGFLYASIDRPSKETGK